MADSRLACSKPKSVQFSFLPVISVKEKSCTSNDRQSMKWQSQHKNVKPFLVLPLLDNERSVSAESKPMKRRTPESMPSNLGLITRNISAGTETWPPKIKQKKSKKSAEKIERPLTATLERPVLLNISLLNKIDMSLVRKEFLSITNLCKVPLENITVLKNKSNTKLIKSPTPSITSSEHKKRTRKPETSEDSLESDENSNVRSRTRKMSKINKLVKKTAKTKAEKNDANNNTDEDSKTNKNTNRSSKRSPQLIETKIIDEVFSGPKSNRSLPEPCKTCGRPDQPERFHSHPAMLPRPPKKAEESPKKQVKSTVQKPVAIKYKPKEKSPQKNPAVMQKVVHSPPENHVKKLTSKGPQTVVCYLCGREFGTASLPLHEPKCLQKWERENAQLPRHQQRKPPAKPDKPLTSEEWNKFAWEAAQAALTPCEHCGRTFLPDRLIVHQRSCKPGTQKVNFHAKNSDSGVSSLSSTSSRVGSESNMSSSPVPGPPTVQCYVCGRMFGTKSIGIHEPQCLKKWHTQNIQLPPSQRLPPPVKTGETYTNAAPSTPASTSTVPAATAAAAATNRPLSGPKKPMLPCYICGREYGTSSIYIHEPQCLKKWRNENDKLPPHKRRKEPERPDIKFTPTGQVDYEATNEAIWQTHLNQLVPCQMCGRKFNPDRVVIHERSCKGQ